MGLLRKAKGILCRYFSPEGKVLFRKEIKLEVIIFLDLPAEIQ